MRFASVVSAFPGCGKSYLFQSNSSRIILDSDSIHFSWADEERTVRNPNFPDNYMTHIQESRPESDLVLVSSHAEVRRAMLKKGIPYHLVMPEPACKEDWLNRLRQRGSPASFVALIDSNWDSWTSILPEELDYNVQVSRLDSGQYLADILNF